MEPILNSHHDENVTDWNSFGSGGGLMNFSAGANSLHNFWELAGINSTASAIGSATHHHLHLHNLTAAANLSSSTGSSLVQQLSNHHHQTPFAFNSSTFLETLMNRAEFRSILSEFLLRDRIFDSLTEACLIFVYAILMMTGFCSNVLIVASIVCNRTMLTPSNILLLNLNLSDLALCLICMPFTLVEVLHKSWSLGAGLCKLVPFMQGVSIFVGSATVSAIALDRLWRITSQIPGQNPAAAPSAQDSTESTTAENYFSLITTHLSRRVLLSTLIIWGLALLLALPIAIFQDLVVVGIPELMSYEICVENWPPHMRAIYTCIILVVQLIIPSVVLGVAHYRIRQYLNRGTRRRPSMIAYLRRNKKKGNTEGGNGTGGGPAGCGPTAASLRQATMCLFWLPTNDSNQGSTIKKKDKPGKNRSNLGMCGLNVEKSNSTLGPANSPTNSPMIMRRTNKTSPKECNGYVKVTISPTDNQNQLEFHREMDSATDRDNQQPQCDNPLLGDKNITAGPKANLTVQTNHQNQIEFSDDISSDLEASAPLPVIHSLLNVAGGNDSQVNLSDVGTTSRGGGTTRTTSAGRALTAEMSPDVIKADKSPRPQQVHIVIDPEENESGLKKTKSPVVFDQLTGCDADEWSSSFDREIIGVELEYDEEIPDNNIQGADNQETRTVCSTPAALLARTETPVTPLGLCGSNTASVSRNGNHSSQSKLLKCHNDSRKRHLYRKAGEGPTSGGGGPNDQNLRPSKRSSAIIRSVSAFSFNLPNCTTRPSSVRIISNFRESGKVSRSQISKKIKATLKTPKLQNITGFSGSVTTTNGFTTNGSDSSPSTLNHQANNNPINANGSANNENNNSSSKYQNYQISKQLSKAIARNNRATMALMNVSILFALSWLPWNLFNLYVDFVFVRDFREPGSGAASATGGSTGSGSGYESNGTAYNTSASSAEVETGDGGDMASPKGSSGLSSTRIYLIFSICHVIAMSSATSNSILYGWLNTNIRRELIRIRQRFTHFLAVVCCRPFLDLFHCVPPCGRERGNDYEAPRQRQQQSAGPERQPPQPHQSPPIPPVGENSTVPPPPPQEPAREAGQNENDFSINNNENSIR